MFLLFVVLLTISPLTFLSQKTQTTDQPQKAVISKPATPLSPSKVTKAPQQSQKSITRVGSPVPQQTRIRATNARYKDGEPKRPAQTTNPKPSTSKSENDAIPTVNRSDEDTSLFIATDPAVMNYRKAYRENRHCGCRSEITFINNTSDTLDMYFRYLNQANTPSIDGVVLPPISLKRVYAPFFIEPGDTTVIRGVCRGALQYEARSRRSFRTKGTSLTPGLEFSNYVRMGCMPREVIFRED
jgi:hypothetical protein